MVDVTRALDVIRVVDVMRVFPVVALVVAGTVFAMDSAVAQEVPPLGPPINTLTDGEREAGWELLFDGQTIAGWRGYMMDAMPEGWEVIDGELTLIDELFTADSSRFWTQSDYKPGASPPAFDKQFVRNWLLESGWDREPPAPDLPADIIRMTRDRYIQAFERLTGDTFVA